VTDHTAPPSKEKSLSRRLRDTAAAYPDAIQIGVYALIAIAAMVAAYLAIFTIFQPYDDEGTLLVTVKAFANGDTLYRDVYSAYGPFYYELFGGLFALTGHDVTTDASRTIVIVVWVGTSLLFGLSAQRLTGRLALGATAMIAAFAALGVLVNEPMHPQGLCVLLIAAFVALAVREPGRRSAWLGGACGALLAALVLTKVNIGIFATAAAVLAAVWTYGPLYRRRWLVGLVTLAFLAMPLFIVSRDLSLGWVRELVVLEVLAGAAILVAAYPLRSRPGEEEAGLGRWLLAGMAGFAVAFLAIFAIIVATGPSPADVYDGIVTQALEVRDVLVLQFQFPLAALDWSIAAVAAAVLTVRLRAGATAVPRVWPGLLRAVAGLAILFSVARVMPFGLDPAAGNPIVLPIVLAWVAAVPLAGARESAHKRFLRILLPALALAESLQVYPVAGSQVGIAAVSFVPVAALCLGDALSELRAWGAARGSLVPERVATIASVATIALAGLFALNSIVLPAITNALLYRDQEELPLPGANLMHLPAPAVETYTGIVDLLRRNHCTTFVGYPSTNSLYLWSGLEGPPPQLPNAWMDAFDPALQRRVVRELRASGRPCAVVSEERASMYLQGGAAEDLLLVHYIFNDFEKAGQAGDFQLLVPKGDSAP
jgi:hypothetical protein